jgi:hypothetical protein
MTKILDPEQSDTFTKIFELKAPADDIINEFDYILEHKRLNLPQYSGELDDIDR